MNTLQNISELVSWNKNGKSNSSQKTMMQSTSQKILALQNRDSACEAQTHLQQLPFPILTFGMYCICIYC